MQRASRVEALILIHVDGNEVVNITVDIRAAESVGDGTTRKVEGDSTHGSATVVLDVGALVGSTFRATIDIGDGTTIDIKGDITRDVGLVGATVDILKNCSASNSGGDIADDGHLVATAKEVSDFLGATAAVFNRGIHGTADSATFITSSEELIDIAAMNLSAGTTATDIGFGILYLAVTATKNLVEATAVNFDTHAVCIGSITATEDTPDGVFAGVDGHSGTSVVITRNVVSISSTTKNIGDGISSIALSSVVCVGMRSLVDIHRDIALWRAVGVITAIDRTTHERYKTTVGMLSLRTDIHLHIAFDHTAVNVLIT